MNDQIREVLTRLEGQSRLEKTDNLDVSPDDKMFAITQDTGEFFNIMLKAIGAKKILEVGMSAGYSTLWLADAVIQNYPKRGKVITIEQNPSKIKKATTNFDEAGISRHIEIRCGLAIDILHDLAKEFELDEQETKFDFAFIDADKENTIRYFDLILPMIRRGGIIATDNMLYPEKFRPEMKKFSDHIRTKSNVQTLTVSIGNGEEITIKTAD